MTSKESKKYLAGHLGYLKYADVLVNKTQEDLKEKYEDWNIEKFSDTEIILSKEEEGECGEHYICLLYTSPSPRDQA